MPNSRYPPTPGCPFTSLAVQSALEISIEPWSPETLCQPSPQRTASSPTQPSSNPKASSANLLPPFPHAHPLPPPPTQSPHNSHQGTPQTTLSTIFHTLPTSECLPSISYFNILQISTLHNPSSNKTLTSPPRIDTPSPSPAPNYPHDTNMFSPHEHRRLVALP